MPKPFRVTVLGREYALRVEEDNEDLMREVVADVDGRMQAFREAHPEQARLTVAVITALGLAEEVHVLRRQLGEQEHALERELADELQQVADELAGLFPAPPVDPVDEASANA